MIRPTSIAILVIFACLTFVHLAAAQTNSTASENVSDSDFNTTPAPDPSDLSDPSSTGNSTAPSQDAQDLIPADTTAPSDSGTTTAASPPPTASAQPPATTTPVAGKTPSVEIALVIGVILTVAVLRRK
ncbi:MAG: hypothetical protein ACYDCK_11770 [Thermoplasmatota archaeon]